MTPPSSQLASAAAALLVLLLLAAQSAAATTPFTSFSSSSTVGAGLAGSPYATRLPATASARFPRTLGAGGSTSLSVRLRSGLCHAVGGDSDQAVPDPDPSPTPTGLLQLLQEVIMEVLPQLSEIESLDDDERRPDLGYEADSDEDDESEDRPADSRAVDEPSTDFEALLGEGGADLDQIVADLKRALMTGLKDDDDDDDDDDDGADSDSDLVCFDEIDDLNQLKRDLVRIFVEGREINRDLADAFRDLSAELKTKIVAVGRHLGGDAAHGALLLSQGMDVVKQVLYGQAPPRASMIAGGWMGSLYLRRLEMELFQALDRIPVMHQDDFDMRFHARSRIFYQLLLAVYCLRYYIVSDHFRS